MSSDARYLLLFAACATFLCWGNAQRFSEKPSTSDSPRYTEPNLLPANPVAGYASRRISTNDNGVYYQRGSERNVRPASANMALVGPLAAHAVGQVGVSITKVSQGDYFWPRRALQLIPLLSNKEVTLHVAGLAKKPTDAELTVAVDGAGQEKKLDFKAGVLTVTLTLPPSPVKQSIELLHGGRKYSIDVRLPGTEPLNRPKLTGASNNQYAEPSNGFAATTNVYDRYLRLTGQSVQRGTPLKFQFFTVADTVRTYWGEGELANPPVKIADNRTWDAEVWLPDVPAAGASYQLIVLATNPKGDQHHVSQEFDTAPRRLTVTGQDPAILKRAPAFEVQGAHREGNVAFVGKRTIIVKGATPSESAARVAVFFEGGEQPLSFSNQPAQGTGWEATVSLPTDGVFQLQAATVLGNTIGTRSDSLTVRVGTQGPRVVSVDPANLASSRDGRTVTVQFDPQTPIDEGTVKDNPSFVLKNGKGDVVSYKEPPKFDQAANSVTVQFNEDLRPDNYTFTVMSNKVKDKFGNPLQVDHITSLYLPVGGDTPTVSRGISGHTGPNVEFQEYTKPRKIIDGFNASDHVETRVARLYYYRDAHRVAQIINREAKSYNRAAVDMQQQLADKARQTADQATDARRAKERKAIEAARKTREAEEEQKQAEQTAQAAAREVSNVRNRQVRIDDQNGIEQRDQDMQTAERIAASARAQAQSARVKVQQLRETEAQANEESLAAAATEDRARENQFRREVAAAHADPDTYAAGKPESQDPVRQVSVSVIGEGLLQLRGPMKGINIIRTMINQMDAPVGQVRVGVHTVQINGEKGDRMEVVAGKIQRYIDHSRFLTLQSAEMFRKAIVQVAAQKASELGRIPGMTQDERDRSYLHSFFGEDFIRELEAMDSEFLHTGNKLLSLHSMDSTSLASAMFIMALAKNTTRMQILQMFEAMMASELPMAEQAYFEAGLTCDGKERLFNKNCKPEDFQLLSQNARFQSIRGMFNAEFAADDTMTPIQREFVRLAQIFKSRLIVEMELKQRIMERSVIEERMGDHAAELRIAKEKEKVARDEAEKADSTARQQLSKLVTSSRVIEAEVVALKKDADAGIKIAKNLDIVDQIIDAAMTDERIATLLEFDANDRVQSSFRAAMAERGRKMLTADICTADSISIAKRIAELQLTLFRDFLRIGEETQESFAEVELTSNESATLDDIEKSEGFFRAIKTATASELAGLGIKPQRVDLRLPTGFGVPVLFQISADGNLSIPKGQAAVHAKIRAGRTAAANLQAAISRFRLPEFLKAEFNVANDCLKKVTGESGDELNDLFRLGEVLRVYAQLASDEQAVADELTGKLNVILGSLSRDPDPEKVYADWVGLRRGFNASFEESFLETSKIDQMDHGFSELLRAEVSRRAAEENVARSRRPLDHKKFLDMLVDEMEDKYIELLEGTRAHTANLDAYIKRLMTSLDDDFNTQFYYPTFRKVREASQMWDVQMGQVETTTVLANNRAFAKVSPQATMEFDLPKRDILIAEAMDGAKAMVQDFGALAQDPTFLAMAKLGSGQPTSTQSGGAAGGQSTVRNVLPPMSTGSAESVMSQQGPGGSQFGAALEGLIPDPAIYKFETGTGWEIRPVIQPDGQALVFHFNYMYSTNIREPVRADEKHLGRIKRHYVDTDVQLSNFELREISRYTVALKASRTSRGVPLLEDVPVVGVLFRPQPSDESSLQQNIILGQSTIFPTLFDLMGLRWAPVVADLDPLRLSNDEFVVRNRRRALMNRVFDQSSSKVDEFLRIPEGERRMDLYRSQESLPTTHPDGYSGPGANLRDSQLREGYSPTDRPESQFTPSESGEGSQNLPTRRRQLVPLQEVPIVPPQLPGTSDHSSLRRRTSFADGVATAAYRTKADVGPMPTQRADFETTQQPRRLETQPPRRLETPPPRRLETHPTSRLQRLPSIGGNPARRQQRIPRHVAR